MLLCRKCGKRYDEVSAPEYMLCPTCDAYLTNIDADGNDIGYYYELEDRYLSDSEVYESVDAFLRDALDLTDGAVWEKARKYVYDVLLDVYSGQGYYPFTYLGEFDDDDIEAIRKAAGIHES